MPAVVHSRICCCAEQVCLPSSRECSNNIPMCLCGMQINPMTVYGMLHESNIPKGEYLLQTAATSVLARQMVDLAKHYGVKTINIVRRKEAVDELKQNG